MESLIFEKETYAIRGTVFEVYREMGYGFLEAVYQECRAREFDKQGIPFVARHELTIVYKGERLNQVYKPDFICYDKSIVELKAVKRIASEHVAQTLSYLKASGIDLGLVVNFGSYPKAEIERLVY